MFATSCQYQKGQERVCHKMFSSLNQISSKKVFHFYCCQPMIILSFFISSSFLFLRYHNKIEAHPELYLLFYKAFFIPLLIKNIFSGNISQNSLAYQKSQISNKKLTYNSFGPSSNEQYSYWKKIFLYSLFRFKLDRFSK